VRPPVLWLPRRNRLLRFSTAWLGPVPRFTKEGINAAGKVVRRALDDDQMEWSEEDWAQHDVAVAVINNWRSSHAYPLNTFQVNLRRSSRQT
jgi:hypothetical protein